MGQEEGTFAAIAGDRRSAAAQPQDAKGHGDPCVGEIVRAQLGGVRQGQIVLTESPQSGGLEVVVPSGFEIVAVPWDPASGRVEGDGELRMHLGDVKFAAGG